MKYSKYSYVIKLDYHLKACSYGKVIVGLYLWHVIVGPYLLPSYFRSIPVAKFFAVCTCGKVPPAGGSVQNLFHFLVKARTVLEYVLNVKLYEYVAF